jgi:hypothetical protein
MVTTVHPTGSPWEVQHRVAVEGVVWHTLAELGAPVAAGAGISVVVRAQRRDSGDDGPASGSYVQLRTVPAPGPE